MKYLVKARRAIVIYEQRVMEIEAESPAIAKAKAVTRAKAENQGPDWKKLGSPIRKPNKIEIEGEGA